MEFKKLNAPSLKELFVNELQNMILSGKLEIGSKLPPERVRSSTPVSRNWKRKVSSWSVQESEPL